MTILEPGAISDCYVGDPVIEESGLDWPCDAEATFLLYITARLFCDDGAYRCQVSGGFDSPTYPTQEGNVTVAICAECPGYPGADTAYGYFRIEGIVLSCQTSGGTYSSPVLFEVFLEAQCA